MLEEVAHNRQQSFRLPQYPATTSTKDPHGRLPQTATSRSWERGRAAETDACQCPEHLVPSWSPADTRTVKGFRSRGWEERFEAFLIVTRLGPDSLSALAAEAQGKSSPAL